MESNVCVILLADMMFRVIKPVYLLSLGQNRSFSVSYRFLSNKSNSKYEGIRERFDENEARQHFDRWLQSLWFAPGGWRESTRDDAITVTRRYVPFWHLSLRGTINAAVGLAVSTATRSGKTIVPTQKWYSAAVTLNNFSLNEVNIYAAQTLDRYHLNQLNVSFNRAPVVNLNNVEKDIEQWTVDQDTAFHIGWDLNIVPQLKSLCVDQGRKNYPGYNDYQVQSFHFNIHSKKQRLLYYPIYVIEYKYGSQTNFTCLVDGVTGEVTGDRQYSMVKVTFATLVGFYPLALTALATLGSLIDPSIGVALASLLSFQNSIPIALVVAPLAGLFAKHYPKLYRERISQQQWQNYRSNATQFTYDFTGPFEQQYQSYRQQQQQQQQQQSRQQHQQQQSRNQQQQQRTRESASQQRQEEVPMDLYHLLSVSRTATDREIKRAYLMKAKELHPDRNPGDKKSEELFKKVNQAYAILSDKYKREQYDKYGYESVKYS